MTIAGPTPVNYEQERAELEAVLGSPTFVRAPKLAHLLSYLCERLFAGETSQIKEYSIGVEVFQRGPAFDQDSDSIVRVEANRLRKRLADYYAGDGATHALKITIPLGQYVPLFTPVVRELVACEANDGSATESPPGTSAVDPAAQRRPNGLRRAIHQPWGFLLGVIIAVALVYGWRVSLRRAASLAAHPAVQPVYSNGFQFGPPPGPEIRILAGANRSLVDHAGKLWSSDTEFTGGAAVKSDVLHIWRTQDQSFYRTSRQGQS